MTIHPESSIFTVSIGQECIVKFVDKNTGSESLVACSSGSLYHMSRKSQEIYAHLIEQGSITSGTRYSLTFRSVDWKNRNSTCLIGDSNTGPLRFGSCKRNTFGELMPGKKFFAPRVEDVDPKSCMGYANVVLLCGINDVRQPEVKTDTDVINVYQQLKSKIRQIQELSPDTRIFVCRLLPTKNLHLNQRVDIFNRAIHFDMLQTCAGVVCVDGFMRFARDHVLACELSKTVDRHGRQDALHLNNAGARVLASLIKRSIFTRLHGGRDRRTNSGRVDGRQYVDVARNPPAPRRLRSDD